MSEKVSISARTCQIIPPKGHLPDLKAMEAALHEVGDPFTLKGVEATVVGQLTRHKGQPFLTLAGTGERLRLRPLEHKKVQWDSAAKKELPATPEEKRAYRDLLSRWNGKPRVIRVVGPLAPQKKGEPMHLEVREFTWDDKPAPSSATKKEQDAPEDRKNN